jgi:hypothetical protein
VIDDLSKSRVNEMLEDEAVAYFYCNRNEESRRNPQNVLRSLVKQLAVSPDMGAIHTILVELFNKKQKERDSFGAVEPDLRTNNPCY